MRKTVAGKSIAWSKQTNQLKEKKSYVTEKNSYSGRNEKCVDVTICAGSAALVFNARFERHGANQL
jgi:hypothetical protein